MVNFIEGGIVKDSRGQIKFVNDFDMSLVNRFYIIKNNDLNFVRGWRGHKIEQRWFYVLSGAFYMDFVKIDDWETPSQDLKVEQLSLSAQGSRIIHVPAGYATAFQALESESEILVFSDFSIAHASQDDYTFDLNYFSNFRAINKI